MKNVRTTAQEAKITITTDCVEGANYDDCATKISKNEADLVTLDGGRVFEAGRMSTRPFDSFLMISMELAVCSETAEQFKRYNRKRGRYIPFAGKKH